MLYYRRRAILVVQTMSPPSKYYTIINGVDNERNIVGSLSLRLRLQAVSHVTPRPAGGYGDS